MDVVGAGRRISLLSSSSQAYLRRGDKSGQTLGEVVQSNGGARDEGHDHQLSGPSSVHVAVHLGLGVVFPAAR